MNPAIGKVHKTPALELSVKAMPNDEPVPSQVQVRVNASDPRDHKENCRGISRLYPPASNSKSSMTMILGARSAILGLYSAISKIGFSNCSSKGRCAANREDYVSARLIYPVKPSGPDELDYGS